MMTLLDESNLSLVAKICQNKVHISWVLRNRSQVEADCNKLRTLKNTEREEDD